MKLIDDKNRGRERARTVAARAARLKESVDRDAVRPLPDCTPFAAHLHGPQRLAGRRTGHAGTCVCICGRRGLIGLLPRRAQRLTRRGHVAARDPLRRRAAEFR
ncbi:hypothetical protein GNZ24_06590 [Burkholderia thailandensis]|uniref:hypothetical protein n=1 Tax=Burkholderia thailandensis TaxID=57975 RepID=UPI0012E8EFDC|nr:hypothetical protein [Burkholderia thailandensis]MBS2128467.1 hypothetical protein [Burkholderia thailandensis]MUV26708.1 hypothetical protein [Burkholderia thailandensis]QRA11172.1 hypothetical protein JMY07_00705 [Burkholderia thailandensis]